MREWTLVLAVEYSHRSLSGHWWGGGKTAAEVDDLEITNCGIGGVVFLTPHLNWLSRTPARGRREGR